jgi:hypothetical protein
MKSINEAFDEYCRKYQTRWNSADVARNHSAESFFAGAAAMANLFAEAHFSFMQQAKEMSEQKK